ncbi:MAG: ACT domain-containing protein [Alphaproteobacteria bacterium]
MTKLVLTLVADDRPGLIKSVSDIVVAHHGNWLESRLAQLAGKFAGIVLVDVPAEQADELTAALAAFGQQDARIVVEVGDDTLAAESQTGLTVTVSGADHPGIVNEVTDLLARHAINVTEMSSEQEPAAMSGQPVFSAHIEALAPDGTDRAALDEAFQALAAQLAVDIDLG